MEEKIVTSSNVESLLPDFIKEDSGNFSSFIKYYYESLERSSYPLDVIYNLTNYFDLDSYTPEKLISKTTLIKNTEKTDDEIVVSSTNGFPDTKGSVLIDNEIIYYEYKTEAPKIKFLPNLNVERVRSRFIKLDDISPLFDGDTNSFDIKLLNKKVFSPSANHILVKLNNIYLKPGVDYKTNNEDSTVNVGSVQFTEAPEQSTDQNVNICQIEFLQGFVTENVKLLDPFTVNQPKRIFDLKFEGSNYYPITDSYLLVFKNGSILELNKDYSLTDYRIIFKDNLSQMDDVFVLSIESQVPQIGSGAKAYSVVENGELQSIQVETYGSGYTVGETPKVQIYSSVGDGATAYPLVNGIKSIAIIDAGVGYDENNPPYLTFNLLNTGNIQTEVVVKNGSISEVKVINSGFNIQESPKINVIDPKMPVFGAVTIEPTIGDNEGYSITNVEILDPGYGLTSGPILYIDDPLFGSEKLVDRPQVASIVPIVSNGQVVAVDIINGGLGFDPQNPPRVKSIDYRNAQILDIKVVDGSITGISLLSGGHGYLEAPTVYIVDNRYNAEGVYIGGTGARARAVVFNGSITDIVIEDFGTGYSQQNPPNIYISAPKKAQLVADVGDGEITGFEIIERGTGYLNSAFKEAGRGSSGLYGFDSLDNTDYRSTVPECHVSGSIVRNQYSEYLKYFLRRIKNQFLPEFPEINFELYDIRNLIKKIKTFYSTKGTKSSVESFFSTVFEDDIDVSFPKDQIMKSSDALWSADTIMRVELINGDIKNILGNVIYQKASDVDKTVVYSESTVDYITTIQTAKKTLYELVLDTNTYTGEFKVSYTTKLSESIDKLTTTITVDSTVGWPENNGYFYIGSELVTYKSKSLNQFFECTRAVNGITRFATGGSKVSTNFYVYYNEGQSDQVVLKVLGVSKTESTKVDDPANGYIEGDIVNLTDLGTDIVTNVSGKNSPLVNSWVYNVKKIQTVQSIELKQKAGKYVGEVTLDKDHSLIRGQSIDIFGASPSFYNGSFTVENLSSTNKKTFDYAIDLDEQEYFNYISTYPSATGDIYLSIPLEKGKSDFRAIERIVQQSTTDIQNSYLTDDYVYIASSGIPSYSIGETGGEIGFRGNALLPGNQRYLKRFPKRTEVVSEKVETEYGQLGLFLNGVPLYSYKSKKKIKYGSISKVNIVNGGQNYDVEYEPEINVYKTVQTITGTTRVKNPGNVKLRPVVSGSIIEIIVLNGGSGYTEPPVLNISGGGGSGAFLTAVLSGGRISRVVVDNPGIGYIEKPVINIVGGNGTGAILEPIVRGPIVDVKIENGGDGFEEDPTLEVSTGSGARAQAIILNGRIRSIGLLSSGSGYTTPPTVIISDSKSGKNALARTILYTSGPNKGSIEKIEILNNGVNYNPTTTRVEIISVGEGASLTSEIFEWTFDLNNQLEGKFDPKDGYVFVGNNNQFGSEYAHTKNPRFLRYLLGDNVAYTEIEEENEPTIIVISELVQQQVTRHSPILGWAYDGNPIYGPYGFSNPATNPSSANPNYIPMKSGWKLKLNRNNGPLVSDYPLGTFIEDYEYSLSPGVTLDRYNGRFCKTPEFPDGVYAYFVTITGSVESIAEFPYVIGNEFYAVPDSYNFSPNSIQSNLPLDVIRYRIPYESTDVDVVRKTSDINSSLSTEDNNFNLVLEDSVEKEIIGYDDQNKPIYGQITKTYEGYDINDDTFITDDEIAPIEFVEESDIEIYNYFPTTDPDARVDIRISNVNKFETATIEGFTIENGGTNYKVGDILVFDTSVSLGNSPSASISAVRGQNLEELSFIIDNKKPYGKLITSSDHGLTYNDRFKVETTPQSEPQSSYQPFSYKVKVINGVENLDVTSYGIGYDNLIPIDFRFFDEIEDVKLNSIVDNNGSINFIEVENSGSTGLDITNINISIDPPVSLKETSFFITKIKNDRTGLLELPAGSLSNLESGQIISNDIVIDANELVGVTTVNTSGDIYKVTFTTVDQNLVQVGKEVLVTGFSNYNSLNGPQTVTQITGNSFSFLVTEVGGLPSTIEVVSKDWSQISSSNSGAHTLAIKNDGSLWSWGRNDFGQLGTGNRNRRKVPTKINSDAWTSISANGNKSFAIKSDGTLWSWGQNNFGELGIGESVVFKLLPTQIGTSQWIKVSSGSDHALAIKSDGTLWAWGRNTYGQLGNGTTSSSNIPVQVGTEDDWENISAGSSISTAINSSGQIYVWGDSRNSCLGLGQLATVSILNSGRSGTFLTDDVVDFELSGASGKVVSWNPTTRVLILKNFTYSVDSNGNDILPTRNELVSKVSLANDGGILSFSRTSGSTLSDQSSVTYTGVTGVASGSGSGATFTVTRDSNGSINSVVLTDDGIGYSSRETIRIDGSSIGGVSILDDIVITPTSVFGNYARVRSITVHKLNDFGSFLEFNLQTGTGVFSTGETITSSRGVTATVVSYDSSTKKMKISNRTGEFLVNDVITGNTSGAKHTFRRYTPQSGSRITIPTLINNFEWVKVSVSNRSTFAIKLDGTIWTWGDNFFGNLGTGDLLDKNTPTQIGTSDNWIDVSAGTYHTLAIQEDMGTKYLYGWGRSSSYELGNGSLVNQISPVEIVISDINVIESGNSCSFIIKDLSGTDSPLFVFGNSAQGRLGNNKFVGLVSTPTEIQSVSISLNPTSTIIESIISGIDSTNNKIKVSDIVNSAGDYPNDSEYSDDDIIEIVKDDNEFSITQKITQTLTNSLSAFSSSIKLNNLSDIQVGKLVKLTTVEKTFTGNVSNINDILTLTSVLSTTEIYAGNVLEFDVNGTTRQSLVTGVLLVGNTYNISLDTSPLDFTDVWGGILDDSIVSTIPSFTLYDEDIIVIADVDEQTNSIFVRNLSNISKTTLNPIVLSANSVQIDVYNLTLSTDDFGLYNNTFFIQNNLFNGQPLKYLALNTSTPIGGLTSGDIYYVKNATRYTFQLSQEVDDIETLTLLSIPTTEHKFRSVIRKRISNSTYTQNKINYKTVSIDKNENVYSFGFTLDSNRSKSIVFHKYDNQGQLKFVDYLTIPETNRGDGITNDNFTISADVSLIVDNSLYLLVQSIYRQVSGTFVKDLILVKYDISSEQPLKLSTSVILTNGSYEITPIGLFVENDIINIVSNIITNPDTIDKGSVLLLKILEDQPTTTNTLSFTSSNSSVKLNTALNNQNTIYLSNNLYENQPIIYTSFLPIGGLQSNRVYYATNVDNEKFNLSESPDGNSIALTSFGDSLPNAHTISPVLIPNYDVKLQRRISFDDGLVDSDNQISVFATSFDVFNNAITISATSDGKSYIIKADKDTFGILSIEQILGIAEFNDNILLKYNQFGELYVSTPNKLIRFDVNGQVTNEINIGAYDSDYVLKSLIFDYFDNVVTLYEDSSGTETKIVCNYFDYKLDYTKSQIISQTDNDLSLTSSKLDSYNSVYLTVSDDTNNYYSYLYRFNLNSNNTTSGNVSIVNNTSLSTTIDESISSLDDVYEILGRQATQFTNFSISDINIFTTDASKYFNVTNDIESLIIKKINNNGSKPKFNKILNKKFYIEKDAISKISPVVTYSLNKSVNYPIGSIVNFVDNEDQTKVYSGTVLSKTTNTLTATDFTSSNATLIQNIIDNNNIKLRNQNGNFNFKINNTFLNNEKVEASLQLQEINEGTVFLPGDKVEFLSGTVGDYVFRGSATVISYDESTLTLNLKNVYDDGLNSSVYARVVKTIAGELTETAFGEFIYVLDWSYRDRFEFDIPSEYLDSYIFESDNITNGSIVSIKVTGGGSDYTVAPSVIVQNQPGVTGSGLIAIALLDNQGQVDRILVENGGAKFTKTPNILLLGGDGTGATAKVSRMRFTSEVYTMQIVDRDQDLDIQNALIYSQVILGDSIVQPSTGATGLVVSKNRDLIKVKLSTQTKFDTSNINITGTRTQIIDDVETVVDYISNGVEITKVSPCIFVSGESTAISSVLDEYDNSFINTYYPQLNILNNNKITISRLYGVSKVNLIARLFEYVSQVNDVDLIHEPNLYIETTNDHNLLSKSLVELIINSNYTQINKVDRVLSENEFIMKFDDINLNNLPHNLYTSLSKLYYKTPSFNMVYGHTYRFDVSDLSNSGTTLSFSRDDTNRVTYTFNNVIRSNIGPGFVGSYVDFISEENAGQLAYYFNESSTEIGNNYSSTLSSVTLRETPYNGIFRVFRVINDSELLFELPYKPECNAYVDPQSENTSTYVSYSPTSSGSIAEVSIFNNGGYFKVLPSVSSVICPRRIEKVEILDSGTEYEPGVYRDVLILGNGSGGFVDITVTPETIINELDEEVITGRITKVEITNSGEGYTEAFIDINNIPGILGSAFNGSGASLEVIIPDAGTGHSLLPFSSRIGSIRKLSSLNIGFDYTHDYTLKPQIKFPISIQLINAKVISEIIITDPGFGYSSTPIVLIEGGGGTGAAAVATVRNNRISQIDIVSSGSGYFSIPNIVIQSKIPYIVNLDLNLLQFKVPHGIPNGSTIKLRADVVDGDITKLLPIINYPGGMENLIDSDNSESGSYQTTISLAAIVGESNGLLPNQLRLAINRNEALLNNYLTFATTGSSNQNVLTEVFGAKATAVLKLSEFLGDEEVTQLESRVINGQLQEVITAKAKVLANLGWISGPNILRLNVIEGEFKLEQKVLGSTSKASGVINNIITASGFGEIGSTSKIDGKFYEETGKLSSISQKLQSTYYQNFAYLLRTTTPTEQWRDLVLDNLHPAGFSLFSEYSYQTINKLPKVKASSSFSRNISVDVAQSRLSKVFSPGYVEDVLNLNEVSVVGKKLITSENVITSFVEKIDNISDQFDGETTTFDLKVKRLVSNAEGQTTEVLDTVRNNESYLMIYINNILQSRDAYSVQNGQITFVEAPTPRLVTKSRNVTFNNLYPTNGKFDRNEDVYVVRVKEFNIPNVNIWQQNITIVSETLLNINIGDGVVQGDVYGIITEKTLNFETDEYTYIIEVVFTTPSDSLLNSNSNVNINGESYSLESVGINGVADLRPFKFDILEGSEIINENVDIFSYENVIAGNDYSVNILAYKLFDTLNQLVDGNTIAIRLFNFETEEYDRNQYDDLINLSNPEIGPFGLESNANIVSPSTSKIDLSYNVSESNISITAILTFDNFLNYSQQTPTLQIPIVGSVLESQLNREIGKIVSIDQESKEVTVSIKSNINDPLFEENNYLQSVSSLGVIDEGNGDNFIVFKDTSNNATYRVKEIRFKSNNDNTLTDENTTLPLVVDNTLLISKTYGTLNNTDSASIFVQINDFVVGKKSRTSCRLTTVSRINNIDEVIINDGTKFDGYIFNRRNNPDNPNVSLNDISKSFIVPFNKLESYDELFYKEVESSRLLLDDYLYNESLNNRFKSINITLDYGDSEEFNVDDVIEIIRISADVEESAGRFKDARNLIVANKQEIIDRSLAEIAIQHPDFNFPDDPADYERFRYYDSYRLIQQNRTEIVNTSWTNMVTQYPGVASTETKCKRDIGYFVDAISLDVFTGGNNYARKFTQIYFDTAGRPTSALSGEEIESVYAFNEARDLMKLAITNQLTVKDLTVTADPDTDDNESVLSCANVQSNIDTLCSIVTTSLSNKTTDSLPTENLGSFTENGAICARDIGYIVDAVSSDLFRGSNVNVIDAANSYFDTNGNLIYIIGESSETITAFNKARDMMKLAINNQLYAKDFTLIEDPETSSNNDPESCANVQSTIDTLVSIITVVLNAADQELLPTPNPGRSFVPGETLIISNGTTTYETTVLNSDNVNYIVSLKNLYENDIIVQDTELLDLSGYTVTTDRGSSVIDLVAPIKNSDVTRTTVKSRTYEITTAIQLDSVSGISKGLTVTQGSISGEIIEIIGTIIYVKHTSYDTENNYVTGDISFNVVPAIVKSITISGQPAEVIRYISTSEIIPQINKYQLNPGEIHEYTPWLDLSQSVSNNASFISEYAYQLVITNFPYLLERDEITIGRCKTDIGLIVDAISQDIKSGGNYNIVLATRFYFDSNNEVNFLKNEIEESIWAYSRVKDLLDLTSRNFEVTETCNLINGVNYIVVPDVTGIVRGMKVTCNNITDSVFVKEVIGNNVYLMNEIFTNYTISGTFSSQQVTFSINEYRINSQFTSELSPFIPQTNSNVVQLVTLDENVSDLINVLLNAIDPSDLRVYKDAVIEIQNEYEDIIDNVYDEIKLEFSNLVIPNDNLNKCQRDMKIVSDAVFSDMRFGGNANTIEASEFYVSGGSLTYVESELIETAYAFFQLELSYSNLINQSLNFTTNEKLSIVSRIQELFQLLINKLTNNATGTIQDSSVQINKNIDYITDEAFLNTSEINLTEFTSTEITSIYQYAYSIIKSISKNILLGKNQYVIDSLTQFGETSEFYSNTSKRNFIKELLTEVIYLTKLSVVNFEINQNGDLYQSENTVLSYSTDPTISVDPNGWPFCQSIQSAIDTFGTIINNYWTDASTPNTTYVEFNFFPKKVYPENYVERPIISSIIENDFIINKSNTPKQSYVELLETGICKIENLSKRLTLTDISGDLVKSPLVGSLVNNLGNIISVTLDDINDDNSVNISFSGNGLNIVEGAEFYQDNGFTSTIEEANNLYILKDIEGTFYKNNYIFTIESESTADSYINSYEKNSATIVNSVTDRLILDTDSIVGSFTTYDYIYVKNSAYESSIVFAFKGFGEGRTTFDLTTTTLTGEVIDYNPSAEDDPIIVAIDGIIQEYEKDYSITSNQITFSTAPSSSADFVGIYVGKWRKLDDVSNQFDGITQNFGMKINSLPYSISIFGNVQNILVDRNCLFTLNGVIQTPQDSFVIDGSRIRFTNPPKPGTSFIGYVYVGSGIDVESVEVIPQIESNDIIRLSKEDTNREVATVDSLTSLTTFEYPGERIGRTAAATVTLRNGKIDGVSLTSSGSGYIRKPRITVSSNSGDQANIVAELGVSNIEVVSAGYGYLQPYVNIVSQSGQGYVGEILFESNSNGDQLISVIRTINPGFGYSENDTIELYNVGNPSIPTEFKIVTNDVGGIKNIYPVLVGIIDINEDVWNSELFEEYLPEFRVRGSVSKSEGVFISGGLSESKIFVKELTGSFVYGEDVTIVSNANNVSLGTLTKVNDFYLNIGGLGYNQLRLFIGYEGNGELPTDGGFVSIGSELEYQFDTLIKLSDSEFIINIDKSYPYIETREFYIGEKLSVFSRINGEKSSNSSDFVVESWNPSNLKLKICKPTPVTTELILDENGGISSVIIKNKGNNYYQSLPYSVSIEGQTSDDGYEEPILELSLGSITNVKVDPFEVNGETFDGFGRDYKSTDVALVQPIDQFGSTEDVTDAGIGCVVKLKVLDGRGGEIENITIPENLRGSQYVTSPVLITKGGSGYGVKANVSIENNLVSGVDFISRGVGFDSVPQIIFAQKLTHTKQNKIRSYLLSKQGKIVGLTKNVTEDDTQIFVQTTGGFEGSGTLVLGKELVSYTGKTDNSFLGVSRGLNFNYDQKLTLSPGFWNFSIGDILPIVRNVSEESGGISTNIRVYSYEPQSQDQSKPPYLFIKYVVDTLAFIDAGFSNSEGAPSYIGGTSNTSLNGSNIINAQSLQLNNVDNITIGDVVTQTVSGNTIEATIVEIIYQSNKLIVELESNNVEFLPGLITINPDDENPKIRAIVTPSIGQAVEKLKLHLFDTSKVIDGQSDTDLDLIIDKTFVVCQSDDSLCNESYPQIKGLQLLNVDIEPNGFLISDSLYPRNLNTGSTLPYGYISVIDTGVNNKGLNYNGVNNEGSEYDNEISLDGGFPYSLYGVEEINQLGNTVDIGDGLRDGNGNLSLVNDISAVNTGEQHQSELIVVLNKPSEYTDLNIGYKLFGAESEFSGVIQSVEVLSSTIKITLVDLQYSEDYDSFIIDYQQGEKINIYNGNALIVANKYEIKSFEFKTVVLPQ